jgi:biotin carboxyl carrier protein
VTRNGERFVVTVDGRAHEVDVSTTNGISSLVSGTRSYEVAVHGNTAFVDGVPVEVVVSRARPAWARAGGSHAAGDGPRQVVAPMPGKIVKLLVKPGDHVEPRQGLVVVEAMKMENELRARAAGTVAEVRVVEGTTVEAGAILVILES